MYDYSKPTPAEISLALSKRFSNELGATIRARRKALKWTQEKLADESGVNRTTICAIESGRRTCDMTTLVLLCSTLGLRITIVSPVKSEKT